MNEKTLEQYLEEIQKHSSHQSTPPSTVEQHEFGNATRMAPEIAVLQESRGFLNRWRQRKLRNENELEKARMVYDTQRKILAYRLSAAERENKIYVDAKLAEITEAIKTYLQAVFRAHEIERFSNKTAAILALSADASRKMRLVTESNEPERLKKRNIELILKELDLFTENIITNALAKRHQLI